MTRLASPIPRTDPRLSIDAALAHPTFMQAVMELWDRKLDTAAIAAALWERECVIAFCVRIGREQRRERSSWA